MDLARRTADCVRMARDPARLRFASDALLVTSAVLIARAFVRSSNPVAVGASYAPMRSVCSTMPATRSPPKCAVATMRETL